MPPRSRYRLRNDIDPGATMGHAESNPARRKRTAVIAVIAALTLMLSGCGPVDAGTAAADAFEREFADVAGVASVEAAGHNDLPFTGSVDASVIVEDGLDDERIDIIAAEFAEYLSAHTSVSWNASLDAETMRVGISDDTGRNDLILDVARTLARTQHITRVEVGVRYADAAVAVTADGPEALSDSYLIAADAAARIGAVDGRSNARAVTTPPDFEIDDRSWDGEDTEIHAALAMYELIRSRFTLIGAEVTPDELHVRTASEDDVPAVEGFVAAIPTPAGLAIDIQGGVTSTENATYAAAAVSAALADVGAVVEIRTSGNYVNVTIPSAADADIVLAAVTSYPEFLSLSGFGLYTTTQDLSVFDRPADLADSLAIAQAAYALPDIEGVDLNDTDADDQGPTARFEFSNSDEATISAFASTMKPLLLERGWHTWINADGSVEWFTAADPLVLDDPIGVGRDAEGQRFADMLVRLWDAAPR